MQSTLPNRFEVIPQKLVYGGSALGHHDGHPVLVPYALPGERVEVEAVRRAKGMVHTRLLQVLTPAPERVTPACPYFGRCGGCHYQHFEASGQLTAKCEILRETLRRIGHIDWTGEIGLHAAEPWHYRNQIQLKVGRDENGDAALGFFEADSHRLVPIETCRIASPRLNAVLGQLKGSGWAARLAGCSGLDLLVDDRDEEVLVTLHGGNGDAGSIGDELLASGSGIAGVVVQPHSTERASAHGHHRRSDERPVSGKIANGKAQAFGRKSLSYRVGEFQYEISSGSFFQASRFLLSGFVEAVTTCPAEGRGLALDLYAGVGLFTLPLARTFAQVVGVEANSVASSSLARMAGAIGLTNVHAVATRAGDFLRRFAQAPPGLVVLDPPRAGAEGETLRRLAEIGPRRIHYASCQPPTLARDLAFLVGHGYRLESVDLFDLFPQTFHIEALAKLSRA
ncbi:MAG TPA: class I SAM-dependent RNA methyltransferase [Terriglobia bacterium]|nr:class I SAM-dependent RNA methyltransferase [Terriglobia bacterium]